MGFWNKYEQVPIKFQAFSSVQNLNGIWSDLGVKSVWFKCNMNVLIEMTQALVRV